MFWPGKQKNTQKLFAPIILKEKKRFLPEPDALSLGCASLLKGSMGRKQKGLRGRITIPLIDGYQHHQATVYD